MNDARAKGVDEHRNVDMVMVYGVVVDTRLVLFFPPISRESNFNFNPFGMIGFSPFITFHGLPGLFDYMMVKLVSFIYPGIATKLMSKTGMDNESGLPYQ